MNQSNSAERTGSSNKEGLTTIRRTFVERGLRPVNPDNQTSRDHSSTTAAITTITRQHQDEQRELQELNAKFSIYLDRVLYLEDYNKKLSEDLDQLRRAWGGDTAQLESMYGPQLKALRSEIDSTIRDQALQELQIKRHEYDCWQLQQQIANLGPEHDLGKVSLLRQQLDNSSVEFEQIRNQFDQRLNDLARLRHSTENLLNELDGLKNELDNHQLERVLLENELQTLREHAAFQDAIYQSQRAEFLSLNTPVLDVSGFYRGELARAISDIRQDFEVLSQSQTSELEEYYRIKTEEVREEIAAETERKRILASQGVIESMDTTSLSTSLKDNHNELNDYRSQNQQLQVDLDALMEDLQRIQEEKLLQQQIEEQELAQLREELNNKRATIDSILESNVSLRFEISTYRHLLDSEENRLDRIEQQQQQQSQTSGTTNASSSTIASLGSLVPRISDRALDGIATKKMTVQKTARGPISFDSVDLETDAVILVNEKFSGSNQSFQNWTIRRQVDQQTELVYQFPSTFSLRPRQTIRILSKRSPTGLGSTGDVLIADQIDSWGQGRKMVTRLLDDRNDEKAIITQIFQ